MTRNPYLKRLLGEGAEQDAKTEMSAPPETNPQPDDLASAEGSDQVAEAPPAAAAEDAQGVVPLSIEQLAQQWQRGEHMGVATALMFTEASYKDFVDLIFVIGQEAGRELGSLLDELADSENIKPPETPPQYSELLNRVSGKEEAGVV